MEDIKQLSLVKGSHRYVFRYASGNEPDIISSFVNMANDHECEFDWFDAAVLSYQLGRRLESDLDSFFQESISDEY